MNNNGYNNYNYGGSQPQQPWNGQPQQPWNGQPQWGPVPQPPVQMPKQKNLKPLLIILFSGIGVVLAALAVTIVLLTGGGKDRDGEYSVEIAAGSADTVQAADTAGADAAAAAEDTTETAAAAAEDTTQTAEDTTQAADTADADAAADPPLVVNGHAYKLYDVGYAWTEAEAYCESLGGHLMTIGSEDEQSIAEQLLSGGAKNNYWIGGSRVDGDFAWVDGTSMDYTNWGGSEPNNYCAQEDCMMIYNALNPNAMSDAVYSWNDLNGDGTCQGEEFFGPENIGFLCEWDDSADYTEGTAAAGTVSDNQSENSEGGISTTDSAADHADYSGTCGDNLTWGLNTKSGVLTISGTGAMYDYTGWTLAGSDMPWIQYSDDIKTLVIKEGVTSIGEAAFDHLIYLTEATIPDSVETIGNCAFLWCPDLTEITLGKGVRSIGYAAFNDSADLADIYYAGSESDRNSITIDTSNDHLLNASWHYNYSAGADTALTAGKAEQTDTTGIPATDLVEVIPDESETVAEYYVRCNGDMRIRSGPGLDYDELTMVTEARLLVLATREVYEPSLDYGNTWGYVQYFDNGGGYGWCYLGFAHAER